MSANHIIIMLVSVFLLGSITNAQETGTVTDIDGNDYQTVKIGDQWWMAENLRVTRYRNGEKLPNITDSEDWRRLQIGAWSYYKNDPSNDDTYGKLYIWYAVDDDRGLCPEGWHVPSDDEWKQLEMHLGMTQQEINETDWRGINEGGKMKSTSTEPEPHPRWNSPNTEATNESGFSGLPGGVRNNDGNFHHLGSYGFWWSSTEDITSNAWIRGLGYGNGDVHRYYYYKQNGFSVRCIRELDKFSISGTVTQENDAGFEGVTIAAWSEYYQTVETDKNGGYTITGVPHGADVTITPRLIGYSFTPHSYSIIDISQNITDMNFTATKLTVGTVIDIDGNEYQTVKIGDQWWMAENLRVTRYRNGDSIRNVIGNIEWSHVTTGAWSYYSNNSTNDETYGKLYNWYAVDDDRDLCPEGWHVPSDEEWTTLENILGDNVGGKLKSTRIEPDPHPRWRYPNIGSTNESGFSGLPGGYRYNTDGNFDYIGSIGYWWSSTQSNPANAWFRNLHYNDGYIFRGDINKRIGFSVRCLSEDVTTVSPLVNDIPSKIELHQNYPNPFNPSTVIRYGIPERAHIRLSIFNTMGQKIATLVNEVQEAGYYEAVFDASSLPSGVYIYRLQAGEYVESRKMLYLK